MHVTLFDKTGKAECSVAYSTYDTPMVPADNAQPAAETQASTKAQQMQKGPTMDETTPKAWPMSDTKLNTATSPQPLPLLPPLQQQPQSIALPPYSSCAERDSRYAEQLFQEQTDSEQAATGSLVSAPFYLRDLDDRPGCFFCFPDIRIRYPGKYSLRFALMRLPSTEPVTTKPEHILECVFSTAFTVYSIKDFPGVDESTALSKKFAQQGVGIPIRNKGRLKPETGEDPVLD
ncbi:hypothetical protein GGH99_001278 [Coemansia sp. RSA 1285]|nr:hypothetical protein GGH99_001278 [Coemansia sp. RSA 1285]